jgi:L-amino acid N-acyltransferase YncA
MITEMGAMSRSAELRDAEAIAAIYNQGIDDRVATFETEPRKAADIARLLSSKGDTYPTVVVERNGEVVGFAWTSDYSPRACYEGVAEFSVYVARDARGHGIGQLAMRALIAAAEDRGFWKLVSRIFPENEASRRLCRAAGFREVGIYHRHAKLDGQWRDCVIVERLLGSGAEGG